VKITSSGYNNSGWPSVTCYLCWHCSYSIPTVPVRLSHCTKDGMGRLVGFFCSFNCAKSWCLRRNSSHQKTSSSTLLWLCAKKYYGGNPKIQAAPSPEVLEQFGGSLSINQYRASFLLINNYEKLRESLIFSWIQLDLKEDS